MAIVNITSSEPLKMLKLMEQSLDVDLSSFKKRLIGLNMKGELEVSKKVDTNETVTVKIVIVPDVPK